MEKSLFKTSNHWSSREIDKPKALVLTLYCFVSSSWHFEGILSLSSESSHPRRTDCQTLKLKHYNPAKCQIPLINRHSVNTSDTTGTLYLVVYKRLFLQDFCKNMKLPVPENMYYKLKEQLCEPANAFLQLPMWHLLMIHCSEGLWKLIWSSAGDYSTANKTVVLT